MATKTATKLTPAKAAELWIEAKTKLDALKPGLEVAAAVLKDHFRKTGKVEYRGIRYSKSTQTRLDTNHVKAELFDRLADFQTTIEVESLSLAKD